MAWSNSRVFIQTMVDQLDGTQVLDLDTDTFNVSLYNDTITPSHTVAATAAAKAGGVWASGEVFEAGEWPTGGRPLVTPDVTSVTSQYVRWDAADTASVGATADLAAVFGCHIYDDTATTPQADAGVCYIYFGGTNSVTNGTFTVVWAATGIFQMDLGA